ncbi:MAG: hypothetical protein H7832_09710 [Magnetococcus sp. DMHC-6]
MTKFKFIFAFAVFFLLDTASAGEKSPSGQAVSDAVQASGHVIESVGHGVVAAGQVTSAVVSVPLSVGGAVLGSVGGASTAAAGDSLQAVTAPIGTPLPITDEVMTIQPPNEALQSDQDALRVKNKKQNPGG